MSDYFWFEGTPFPGKQFKKEIIEEIHDKFVIRNEDTVILTYPKSGTNWLIEMVCLIQTKGDPNWIQSVPVWERSPWLDTQKGYKTLINNEGPRLITSHLPFHLFPKSFFSSKAKVIYVIRNPRDVVSGYFFWRKTRYVKNPETLTTYFEWFLRGNDRICCIPGWPQNLYIPENNIEPLVFSCLELQSFSIANDTKSTIEKICDFLGIRLDQDELDMVLKYSSFQAMKESKMFNFNLFTENLPTNILVPLRKGTTGDWKNHFTVAQAEAFDKVFQEKMAGFPPGLFPWE